MHVVIPNLQPRCFFSAGVPRRGWGPGVQRFTMRLRSRAAGPKASAHQATKSKARPKTATPAKMSSKRRLGRAAISCEGARCPSDRPPVKRTDVETRSALGTSRNATALQCPLHSETASCFAPRWLACRRSVLRSMPLQALAPVLKTEGAFFGNTFRNTSCAHMASDTLLLRCSAQVPQSRTSCWT